MELPRPNRVCMASTISPETTGPQHLSFVVPRGCVADCGFVSKPEPAPRPARRAYVVHEHHRPRHHYDLRLEEAGVLRSWAVPKGLPVEPGQQRLAVEVADHDLDHLTYEDATKSIADTGWWEEHDRNERRLLFTLHGRGDARRYALIRTEQGWLLRRTKEPAVQQGPGGTGAGG